MQLLEMYQSFVAKYPVVSIEDPFDQDDWATYTRMTAALGESTQVVGDDLLVTNPVRVAKAVEEKCCNALLLKVLELPTRSLRAVVCLVLTPRLGFICFCTPGEPDRHRDGVD